MNDNQVIESHPLFKAIRDKKWGDSVGEIFSRNVAVTVFTDAMATIKHLGERYRVPTKIAEMVVRKALHQAENPNEASRLFHRATGIDLVHN